jgi:hypothetical protein
VDTELRHPGGFTLHQEVAQRHLTGSLEVADGDGRCTLPVKKILRELGYPDEAIILP